MKKDLAAFAIIFGLCLIMVAGFAMDEISKSTTWSQKTKIGNLNEIILYNSFPNTELLVTFKDGSFLLITKNHLGSYAILSQIEEGAEVKIVYKENQRKEIFTESIEEV